MFWVAITRSEWWFMWLKDRRSLRWWGWLRLFWLMMTRLVWFMMWSWWWWWCFGSLGWPSVDEQQVFYLKEIHIINHTSLVIINQKSLQERSLKLIFQNASVRFRVLTHFHTKSQVWTLKSQRAWFKNDFNIISLPC